MPADTKQRLNMAVGFAAIPKGGWEAFVAGPAELEGSKKIHMASAGTWMAMFGPATLTSKHFEEAKKNLDKNIPGVIHPRTGKPAVQGNFSHTPWGKAGFWIHDLVVEGDKLFVIATFTKEGERSIREEEFLSFSVELDLDHVDQLTGERHGAVLFGSAMTNMPAVTDLDPVQFSKKYPKYSFSAPIEPEPTKENKTMTLSELIAAFASLTDTEQSSFAAKVMAILSLSTSAENQTLLTAAQAKVVDFGKLTTELKDATEKLSKSEALVEVGKKENEFLAMLAAGEVTPGQKDHYLSGDMKAFAAAGKEKPNEESKGNGGAGAVEEEAKDATEAFSKLNEVAEKIEADKKIEFSVALDEARELHPKWAAMSDI